MATLKKDAKKASTTDKVKVTTKTGTKETKVSKSELDAKNIKGTIKQAVTSIREVKYKYPEDILNDKDAKKTFRQKTRNTLQKMENDLAKIADKESKAFRISNRKLKAFKAEVLLAPGE